MKLMKSSAIPKKEKYDRLGRTGSMEMTLLLTGIISKEHTVREQKGVLKSIPGGFPFTLAAKNTTSAIFSKLSSAEAFAETFFVTPEGDGLEKVLICGLRWR